MAQIFIPFASIVDDTGALVAGATVVVASVKDPLTDANIVGAVASVVLSADGLRVGVLYDPEAFGQAWITLLVTKVGNTFSGTNASPVAFASLDPQTLASLPASVWAYLSIAATTVGSFGKRLVDYLTGDAFARLGAPAGASVSADLDALSDAVAGVAVNAAAALTAVADLPTIIENDGTPQARFTAAALALAPTPAPTTTTNVLLGRAPYKLTALDMGPDESLSGFVDDKWQLLCQLATAEGVPIPVEISQLTATLTDLSGVSVGTPTVAVVSGDLGIVRVQTTLPALPGHLRLTVLRAVSAQDSARFGPILIEVNRA